MYKTMSLQFPYYYYNRNYYSTLVDHEFDQEEFLNLSKFYWCNSKIETKQSSYLFVNIFVSDQENNLIPVYLHAQISH